MAHVFNSPKFYRNVSIASTKSDEYDERYANIHSYVNEFQINLDQKIPSPTKTLIQDSFKIKKDGNPAITVFKKKNLKKHSFENIYEHNLTKPDIDAKDSTKSKVSCIRCRKFKKKCTRSFPECSNCSSSDELCIYLPRKIKKLPKATNDAGCSKTIEFNSLKSPESGCSSPREMPFPSKRLSLPIISNNSNNNNNNQSSFNSTYFNPSNQRDSEANNYLLDKVINQRIPNDLHKILN